MFGTCESCGAVCVRVFLVERGDETGQCAGCIAKNYAVVDTYVPRHRAGTPEWVTLHLDRL